MFTTTKNFDREDYKAQWTNSKEQGPSWEANMSTGTQTRALSNILSFLITERPNYSRSLMTTANKLYINRIDCTIYWLHGVSYLFINPIPEWLWELLVNISDLDQLVQASRINDVLEHLTSSANHLDCSVNKNDHKSGYTQPFSRLHLPKLKITFFQIHLIKGRGREGVIL